MKTLMTGGAAALPLLLCAAPVLAETPAAPAAPAIDVRAARPDGHGPAGMMADHVHSGGGVMIGLTWMHEEAAGTNRRGNAPVSDAEIVAAGYTARTEAMTMDMAMLHLMYAPSGRVTLLVMPSWQRMAMTMRGIAPAHGHGHGGHTLDVGETMTHEVSGLGDTQIGALVALSRRKALAAHAGLMLSAPTGSVRRKDDDGTFVHYGMQPGSGTWDLAPSFTLRGTRGALGWGAQASYLMRLEDRNRSGFRFGDRFAATGWLSHMVGERLSASARLAYADEGKVEGHYNAGHNHAAPPDRQANYGGQRLDAGAGFNLALGGRLRIGAEASVPLWQRLNGIQAPRRFAASLSAARMF